MRGGFSRPYDANEQMLRLLDYVLEIQYLRYRAASTVHVAYPSAKDLTD